MENTDKNRPQQGSNVGGDQKNLGGNQGGQKIQSPNTDSNVGGGQKNFGTGSGQDANRGGQSGSRQ